MTKLQKQLIIKLISVPIFILFIALYILAMLKFKIIVWLSIFILISFICLTLMYFIIDDYKIRGILTKEEYNTYNLKYRSWDYKELKELKKNGYEL